MSNRLYSGLLQSEGRRYYFALDSAPGIVTPGPAVLTLNGKVPVAVEPLTVFRTPAPATLTLNGLMPGAPIVLSPAPAALSTVGQVPARQLIRTITNALPAAVENPPASFAPTLISIWTTLPGVAQVELQTLPFNLTQGGNIGFVSPGCAQITLGTLQYSLLLGGVIGAGQLSIVGQAPTLLYELTIQPDVGVVSLSGALPDLALPFTWVDDDPAPARTWITDAAA